MTTIATHPDAAAFLASVRAQPDEDARRLAFADWLQDHGEDARAELVRVQVELGRMPPRHRELFVVDGAGTMLEGLGVALIPHGDGHYSASSAESGLSVETFAPGERVDIYAHLARKDRVDWIRGLKYVKHVPERNRIIFRKDEQSGPWAGIKLAARESELLAAHPEWFAACPVCEGKGMIFGVGGNPAVGGRRCSHCSGSGRVGSLLCSFLDAVPVPTMESVLRKVTLTRFRGPGATNPYREDEWQPTAYVRALFATHPLVTRVVVRDREPYWNGSGYCWYHPARPHASGAVPESANVPDFLWGRLTQHLTRLVPYPTPELARDALARALCDVLRALYAKEAVK